MSQNYVTGLHSNTPGQRRIHGNGAGTGEVGISERVRRAWHFNYNVIQRTLVERLSP